MTQTDRKRIARRQARSRQMKGPEDRKQTGGETCEGEMRRRQGVTPKWSRSSNITTVVPVRLPEGGLRSGAVCPAAKIPRCSRQPRVSFPLSLLRSSPYSPTWPISRIVLDGNVDGPKQGIVCQGQGRNAPEDGFENPSRASPLCHRAKSCRCIDQKGEPMPKGRTVPQAPSQHHPHSSKLEHTSMLLVTTPEGYGIMKIRLNMPQEVRPHQTLFGRPGSCRGIEHNVISATLSFSAALSSFFRRAVQERDTDPILWSGIRGHNAAPPRPVEIRIDQRRQKYEQQKFLLRFAGHIHRAVEVWPPGEAVNAVKHSKQRPCENTKPLHDS